MLRRQQWAILFAAMALMGVMGALYYWNRPTHVLVAVGPRTGPEAQLVEAFAKALVQERKDVSIRTSYYDDVRQSAEALANKQVAVAVVRPDAYLPENGLTVAILRQEAVIVVAPEANKITDVLGLAGKRLGVVSRHAADPALIDKLLASYDLSSATVTLVPLRTDAVEAAFGDKKIDAVVMLMQPAEEAASQLIRAVERKALKGKITLFGFAEAEALAQKDPTLTSMTIPAGLLLGKPKLPADDLKTVGVSYRLMARSGLDRDRVALFTEYLFEMRSRLARTAPSANLVKPPEFDSVSVATSALLPNHPGAIDYLQREQQTFFQRYGDWIYLAMFSGGGIGSALAWLAQSFARKRRELVDRILDRLMEILSEARGATTVAALDALAVEIDSLVIHSVRYARHHSSANRSLWTLMLTIHSARSAISDRRREVLDKAIEEEKATDDKGEDRTPRLIASTKPAPV